jgi:hypothetical protein
MRRRVRLWPEAAPASQGLLLLIAALLLMAHIGSPDVFVTAPAGPYPLHVVVQPPPVIPGQADITIRTPASAQPTAVRVRPLQWDAGRNGAPPPDQAEQVAGHPDIWHAQLWLMTASSYEIEVEIDGPRGPGRLVVPLSTTRRQLLGMERGLGILLSAIGLFLIVGLVALLGAGVRESTLPPGTPATPARRRSARWVMAITAVLVAAGLVAGRTWWKRVDDATRQSLFRPLACVAQVGVQDGERVLNFAITDPRWHDREAGELAPDHGKLIHLFLVAEPGLAAFAHLHPRRFDHDHFVAEVPPIPGGRYRVYADLTQENGFAQTLTAAITLPPPPPPLVPMEVAAPVPRDDDDSWRLSPPLSIRPVVFGAVSPLNGGLTMTWLRGTAPLRAGQELTLRFAVTQPSGQPVPLEPYMGMLGHAVILRDDGQVFIHLHPMGTISMGAQELLAQRLGEAAATHAGMTGMGIPERRAGEVTFPYAFPAAGRYRLWVQIKVSGQVVTGVFDTEVGRAS